jgi:hypothetical protein
MALQNAVGERWAHISLGTIRGEVAVLSLQFAAELPSEPENSQLLDAFTQQAGVALERCVLESPIGASLDSSDDVPAASLSAGIHVLESRIERMQQEVLGLRAAARDILKLAPSGEDQAQ